MVNTRNPEPKEIVGSKDLREAFKDGNIRGSFFINGVEMHQFEANSPASVVSQINAKSGAHFVTAEIDDGGHLVLVVPEGLIGDIRRETMAISRQVQDALDRIRETTSIVKAVMESEKVQTAQIATLTEKVTELQSKLDSGGQISADDLSGIAELTSDIDLVNAQLRTAVPANTVADPAANTGGGIGSALGGASAGGANQLRSPGSPEQGGQPEPNDPGREVNNATQGSGEQSVQEAEAERQRQQSGGAGNPQPEPLPGTGAA